MRKILLLIILSTTAFTTFSQADSIKKRWLWFSIYIPSPAIEYQYAKLPVVPETASYLRLDHKLKYCKFDIIKSRLIVKERFYVGAEISATFRKNDPDFKQELEKNNPNYHITRILEVGFSNFSTGFFAGYRQPFAVSAKKTHYIGAAVHLTFEDLDYGQYSYDAKAVTNNSFYSYSLKTDYRNAPSYQFEIDKSTAYTIKNLRNKLILGAKFCVTPRKQTVDMTETIYTRTTTSLPSLEFKSVSYSFGIYLAIEGSIIKR